MKIKHLLLGMLAVAATVACQQDQPVDEAKLEVSTEAVALEATAAEATFEVTSNNDWTATADADWVTLDPASGAGAAEAVTIKLTAEDNEAAEARTATVTVTAGELTKTVALTQAGTEPAPTPEPEPIVKVERGLAFAAATAEAVLGQEFTAPALSGEAAGVVYTSSNTAVATVDAATGAVTLVAAGETTITAAADENETHLAGSASYTLTVAEPAGPQAITVAEFLLLEVGTTEYMLTGVIEGTYNTTYGNFYLNDGTGKVLVYGLTATPQTSNDKSFASLGLRDGDTLTLIGQRADYNGTAQVGGPAYYVSHVAAPYVDFATSAASVDAEVTTYSIEVKSNTAWTATASEGVTLDKTSGEGDATVVMTFAANTAADAVNHAVTFACEGTTATFTLTQKAVPADGEKVVFEESFAKSSGTMGWDGTNGNGTFTADNTGWTVENAYGAGGSAKFGTSSKKGKATTPALSLTGTATLTFKAGAWNNGSEVTTLNLSMTGGTLSVTSVTLKKGAWTEYEVTITDATEGAKITFEASTASKNRFFLDDIKIVQAQ